MELVTQTYTELAAEGRRLQDKGFCGVVALAAATQVDYQTAKAALEEASHFQTPVPVLLSYRGSIQAQLFPDNPRKHGEGTPIARLLRAITELRPRSIVIADKEPHRYGKTIGKVIENAPADRTIIAWTTKHVVTIRNGETIDWTGEGRRHRILQVFDILNEV